MAQDRNKWRVIVNSYNTTGSMVKKSRKITWLAKELLASQEEPLILVSCLRMM